MIRSDMPLHSKSRAVIIPRQRPDKRAYDHAAPQEKISEKGRARQQERYTNEDHVEQRARRVVVAIVCTCAGDKRRQPRPRGAPNRLQQRRAVIVDVFSWIGTATRVAADTTCRSRILRSRRCGRQGVTTRSCPLMRQGYLLSKPQVSETAGAAWPRVRILCAKRCRRLPLRTRAWTRCVKNEACCLREMQRHGKPSDRHATRALAIANFSLGWFGYHPLTPAGRRL